MGEADAFVCCSAYAVLTLMQSSTTRSVRSSAWCMRGGCMVYEDHRTSSCIFGIVVIPHPMDISEAMDFTGRLQITPFHHLQWSAQWPQPANNNGPHVPTASSTAALRTTTDYRTAVGASCRTGRCAPSPGSGISLRIMKPKQNKRQQGQTHCADPSADLLCRSSC